jgi:hypothetical protein
MSTENNAGVTTGDNPSVYPYAKYTISPSTGTVVTRRHPSRNTSVQGVTTW